MIKLICATGDFEWNSKRVARLSKSEVSICICLFQKINEFASKDELLSSGWPNSIVSQNSLSVAIKNIRKALLLTSSNIYIETVHRKGYVLHGEKESFIVVDDNVVRESQEDNARFSQELVTPPTKEYDVEAGTTKNGVDFNSVPHWKTLAKFSSYLSLSKAGYNKACNLLVWGGICISFTLAILVDMYTEELFCYQLSPTTQACGVFYLNDAKKEEIKKIMSNQVGVFFYGYEADMHQFRTYKND